MGGKFCIVLYRSGNYKDTDVVESLSKDFKIHVYSFPSKKTYNWQCSERNKYDNYIASFNFKHYKSSFFLNPLLRGENADFNVIII